MKKARQLDRQRKRLSVPRCVENKRRTRRTDAIASYGVVPVVGYFIVIPIMSETIRSEFIRSLATSADAVVRSPASRELARMELSLCPTASQLPARTQRVRDARIYTDRVASRKIASRPANGCCSYFVIAPSGIPSYARAGFTIHPPGDKFQTPCAYLDSRKTPKSSAIVLSAIVLLSHGIPDFRITVGNRGVSLAKFLMSNGYCLRRDRSS